MSISVETNYEDKGISFRCNVNSLHGKITVIQSVLSSINDDLDKSELSIEDQPIAVQKFYRILEFHVREVGDAIDELDEEFMSEEEFDDESVTKFYNEERS